MSLYLENKKYKRENNPNLCLLLDCSKANYQIIKVSRIKENFSQIFDNPVQFYLNPNTTQTQINFLWNNLKQVETGLIFKTLCFQ